jgi:Mn2+/Fe2+ NRAMP family transporter
MSTQNANNQRERIRNAKKAGPAATLLEYLKLSGPGWLQSAITLGGGSLAGSLYLGIIGGYEMMWLQPLMMIFGIVMLCAIAHVTLCSGEKPFQALNSHVSPVLGWGWIVATLLANLVWAMPQFSLGAAALRQNLGIFTFDSDENEIFTFDNGEFVATLLLLVVSVGIVWMYDKGGKGYQAFDILLKLMVGMIVACFFMVVVMMSASSEGLPWDRILTGFIPNPDLLFEPAESLRTLVAQSSAPEYWHTIVVSAQRDRMVAAAATAVGINMTFLLPYSMLKRGWDKEFCGLVRVDLATGLFIPFLLATSCVVIAAASQFHSRPEPGLIEYHQTVSESRTELPKKLVDDYEKNLTAMLEASNSEASFADLPESDRILAATLIQRDAFALANSLEKFAGKGMAQTLFGIGVVGMAVSSIVILMLINGFAVCEMAGRPSTGWLYRFGFLLPGVSGALGALFLWSGKAKFYLAVPTGRFGMVLLPIAYIAFFCLMNNRRLLGESMPRGRSRIAWNVLMGIAVVLSMIGAAISIMNDTAQIPGTTLYVRHIAIGLVVGLVIMGVIIHFKRSKKA